MGHEGSPSSYQVTGSGTQNITVTVSGLAVFPKININGTSGPLLLEGKRRTNRAAAFYKRAVQYRTI